MHRCASTNLHTYFTDVRNLQLNAQHRIRLSARNSTRLPAHLPVNRFSASPHVGLPRISPIRASATATRLGSGIPTNSTVRGVRTARPETPTPRDSPHRPGLRVNASRSRRAIPVARISHHTPRLTPAIGCSVRVPRWQTPTGLPVVCVCGRVLIHTDHKQHGAGSTTLCVHLCCRDLDVDSVAHLHAECTPFPHLGRLAPLPCTHALLHPLAHSTGLPRGVLRQSRTAGNCAPGAFGRDSHADTHPVSRERLAGGVIQPHPRIQHSESVRHVALVRIARKVDSACSSTGTCRVRAIEWSVRQGCAIERVRLNAPTRPLRRVRSTRNLRGNRTGSARIRFAGAASLGTRVPEVDAQRARGEPGVESARGTLELPRLTECIDSRNTNSTSGSRFPPTQFRAHISTHTHLQRAADAYTSPPLLGNGFRRCSCLNLYQATKAVELRQPFDRLFIVLEAQYPFKTYNKLRRPHLAFRSNGVLFPQRTRSSARYKDFDLKTLISVASPASKVAASGLRKSPAGAAPSSPRLSGTPSGILVNIFKLGTVFPTYLPEFGTDSRVTWASPCRWDSRHSPRAEFARPSPTLQIPRGSVQDSRKRGLVSPATHRFPSKHLNSTYLAQFVADSCNSAFRGGVRTPRTVPRVDSGFREFRTSTGRCGSRTRGRDTSHLYEHSELLTLADKFDFARALSPGLPRCQTLKRRANASHPPSDDSDPGRVILLVQDSRGRRPAAARTCSFFHPRHMISTHLSEFGADTFKLVFCNVARTQRAGNASNSRFRELRTSGRSLAVCSTDAVGSYAISRSAANREWAEEMRDAGRGREREYSRRKIYYAPRLFKIALRSGVTPPPFDALKQSDWLAVAELTQSLQRRSRTSSLSGTKMRERRPKKAER
ncbi:hypothetical protein C8R43DRAFT_963174 [Mycena crocata]|nr:hypothetical protein C8R43DRAFT_963174 [Mycena crocata]